MPKNTLFTFRDGDLIHFGIARCNSMFDSFRRDTGKLIARNRAKVAAGEAGVGGIPGKQTKNVDGVLLHSSGLRGSVNVENVKELLQYFQNVDDTMMPDRLRTEVVSVEAA
jgi:hypothetical protein